MTKKEYFRECPNWKGHILRGLVKLPPYPFQMFHLGIGMKSDIKHDVMKFGMRRTHLV
jgi:hypothetical protein